VCCSSSWPASARLPEEVGPQRISAQSDSEVGVLLVTNVDDIDDLQAALRSQLGERAAVVRWRSPDDNDALRRTARELQANKGN
jgi:hypothetical protein